VPRVTIIKVAPVRVRGRCGWAGDRARRGQRAAPGDPARAPDDRRSPSASRMTVRQERPPRSVRLRSRRVTGGLRNPADMAILLGPAAVPAETVPCGCWACWWLGRAGSAECDQPAPIPGGDWRVFLAV